MNVDYHAAADMQEFCRSQGWPFCFIGGVALQRWGEPRQTIDVDATLLAGFGDEEAFVDPLITRYRPRRPDARAFALQHRVLLIENDQGIGLDIALGGLPFEERTVERASDFRIGPDQALFTCCAEDLLVHKVFAGRAQDWVDVENVLIKQRGKLNLPLVFSELEPLLELKQESGSARRLRAMVARLESAP